MVFEFSLHRVGKVSHMCFLMMTVSVNLVRVVFPGFGSLIASGVEPVDSSCPALDRLE